MNYYSLKLALDKNILSAVEREQFCEKYFAKIKSYNNDFVIVDVLINEELGREYFYNKRGIETL